MHLLQPNDLVYLEPPYFSYDNIIDYGCSELAGEKGQERIHKFALELDKKGVFFMMSNYHTPFITNLYNNSTFKNLSIDMIVVKRGGKKQSEVIIRNYK